MSSLANRISQTPFTGIFSVTLVWFGMALGHSLIVIQHGTIPMGAFDSALSFTLGLAGFALVWIGMKKPETQATVLGYIGGNMIWCGWFEWTWRY